MSRFFAALYVSEPWHSQWRLNGSVYAKAKAIVMFDRIMTGGEHRILLNGIPLDEYAEKSI